MAEPERDLVPVTIARGRDEITVDVNPDDLIDLKAGDSIGTVNVTIGGEPVMTFRRIGTPGRDG
jgi:hypothetical protein